jgi:hypothetical protein
VSSPSRRDLAAARARVTAVTDWIAARAGSSQPDPATADAAADILHHRDITASVPPAAVYHVRGHLVAIYHFGPRGGPVANAECSCARGLCEHLLAALAYEVSPLDHEAAGHTQQAAPQPGEVARPAPGSEGERCT